jgi:hypothetical protein
VVSDTCKGGVWGVMLCEVIGEGVVCLLAPMYKVFSFDGMVLDPVKAHVHGFGATLLDHVLLDDADSAGMAGLNWEWHSMNDPVWQEWFGMVRHLVWHLKNIQIQWQKRGHIS